MPPGRPASIRTRHFSRHLSDADVAILAHAGDGDISAGFRNLIDWYWQNVNSSKSSDTDESNNSAEYSGPAQE
jgi:hypothetical protein